MLSRFLILSLVCLCLPGLLRADQVTVFAAASLKTALDTVAAEFEAGSGHDITLSYAGSSALARQIEAGAPADLFVSANPGWMDHLEAQGLLVPGSRRDLLRNALVVIAHGTQAPALELADLPSRLDGGRLAMALVSAVPAGIYGKAALESLGLWGALAPQVAQADNVRAALALVAVGEAPFGVVYATDAQAEPRVSVVATFPEGSHAPITYPVARIVESRAPAADAFLTFLGSSEVDAIFVANGFDLADGGE